MFLRQEKLELHFIFEENDLVNIYINVCETNIYKYHSTSSNTLYVVIPVERMHALIRGSHAYRA